MSIEHLYYVVEHLNDIHLDEFRTFNVFFSINYIQILKRNGPK